MALAAVKVTIGQSLGGGNYSATIKGGSAPGLAAVVADTATLVADGASPTQAHVTTLNTDMTALSAALAGDVVVMWDTTNITSRQHLRAALLVALQAVEGGYGGLAV